VSATAEVPVIRGFALHDPLARQVFEEPTLVRELAPVRFVGTFRTTDWLMDQPPIAAALARHLHPPLEKYLVTPRSDGGFDVTDGGSLRGTFWPIARGKNRRLYLCDGDFRSAEHVLQVSGRLLMFLEYRALPARDGEPQMELLSTLYVRLENVLAHGFVKLIAPFLSGVIERRTARLAAATQILSRRVTLDPRGLYAEMLGWPDLPAADLEAYRRAFLADPASH
jgi:hypothetical protein